MTTQMKIGETLISTITKRINKLQMENTMNMSFIKAVLFKNNLSNEECYRLYTDEWKRLNKDLIDSFINNLNTDMTNDTGEHDGGHDLEAPCDHEKIYADYILTSYPPKYPWKCRLCNETGEDDESTRYGALLRRIPDDE
jgi:hypothetical protein